MGCFMKSRTHGEIQHSLLHRPARVEFWMLITSMGWQCFGVTVELID